MEANASGPAPGHDLEHAVPYTRLSGQAETAASLEGYGRSVKNPAGIFLAMLCLASLIALIVNQEPHASAKVSRIRPESSPGTLMPPSRGPSQGVSEKTFRGFSGNSAPYPWTNDLLAWQRTGFHFQPENNWMNDPNGPLFHKGWYHLFYQYNPDSPVWANITWGHAVSKDLIRWFHLPIAMVPDQWYDLSGVWTGSATVLPDGQILMLYTGNGYDLTQTQNLAYPANLSDPLLLDWVKYPGNPVIVPPRGIGLEDFRDPTTAWMTRDGQWRVALGTMVNKTGMTLLYDTGNFTSFELLDEPMHVVPGTGMWECVDFFPVSTCDNNGLDTSFDGPGIKHMLKASVQDVQGDFYGLGTYDPASNKWTPDNPELDLIGLRVDHGRYYAGKTFYDPNKQRRILWGWISETDSEKSDTMKGWASLQAIPRTVVYDQKTGSNILQWPVEEVERLRLSTLEIPELEIRPGSIVPLNISSASQLDIEARFEVEKEAVEGVLGADVGYNCSCAGATVRGALGPFGLVVIADESLSELTPVYFYISKGTDGSFKTYFCLDEMRSSKASDVSKKVYGGRVPVVEGEKFSMRVLVDHSIVESFAQGGRTVITSRVYPTRAVNGAAGVFLFNNATQVKVKASVNLWEMDSAQIQRFPLHQM